MNRNDFLLWLLNKFGCFNENNIVIWRKDYELVLSEPNIDYDGLYNKIVREWSDTFRAPSTQWINDTKRDFIPKDTTCEALKEVRQMREESASQTPEQVAQIDAIRERMRKTLGKMGAIR